MTGATDRTAATRRRLLDFGPESITDGEHLAALLHGFGRADAVELSDRLMKRYGTFADAVSAAPARLRECGVPAGLAEDLRLIAAVPQRVLRAKIISRPVLGRWHEVIDYCQVAMSREAREQFRILFLDKTISPHPR